jgi:hypothetical protein
MRGGLRKDEGMKRKSTYANGGGYIVLEADVVGMKGRERKG